MKLKKNQIILALVLFVGIFSLQAQITHIRGKKIVGKEIKCSDSLIQQTLTLKNNFFFKDITFSSIDFCDTVNFSNSLFLNRSSFSSCKFFNRANFSRDTFVNYISISSEFNDYADFSQTFCFKSFNMWDTRFDNEVDFYKVIFMSDAALSNIEFRKRACFRYCEFPQNVYFGRVQVLKELDFANAKFGRQAIFDNLSVADSAKIIFDDVKMPDSISFENNMNLSVMIDLTRADYTGKYINIITDEILEPHWINLYKANLSKFKIPFKYFRLYFNASVRKDEKAAVYETLLKNLDNQGLRESYKYLDIEYQEYKWSESLFSMFVIIPKYWWDFGYSRENVFIWAAIFLLFFTFITCFFLDFLSQHVYSVENLPLLPKRTSSFDAGDKKKKRKQSSKEEKKIRRQEFKLRLWYSFIYSVTLFLCLTLKLERLKFKSKKGVAYVFLIYSVGILCLAYMANFVLQK